MTGLGEGRGGDIHLVQKKREQERTVLHCIPQRRSVRFGQAHYLLSIIVTDEVGLFGAVEERVANVPLGAVANDEAPGERCGLVQIEQQADRQVPQLDLLVVEAGAGDAEVGGQAGEQQGQVAEARDCGDKGRVGEGRVRDVQGHLERPECLRYGFWGLGGRPVCNWGRSMVAGGAWA